MRNGTVILVVITAIIMSQYCFGAEKSGPPTTTFEGKKAGPGVGLTIYNDNFAVVRESRNMKFEKGRNTVKFTDVASAIDPTSVKFMCLSSPGAVTVLEQNYEYDLVNTDSLLKRYIDKNITLKLKGSGADAGREAKGILMAAIGGDLIIKGEDGEMHIVDKAGAEEVSLKEAPEDLVTKPTLVWLANAEKGGEQLCEVTYTTEQINWKADYSAVLNADDTALDFSGWVTIDNKSGAGYRDAALKLIAGNVRRVQPAMAPRMYMAKSGMADMAEAAGGFQEKSFMEYHMYTLGRKSTINNNQVKQIEFIEPATGVTAKKIFVYDLGDQWFVEQSQGKGKVKVKIEFENKKENKLGIALPKGKVRVFKKDSADNSLQFVGEDEIDHTPKDEKVSLYIGDAFDIVAEHTLLDSKHETRMAKETHKVELRNRKAEAVTVFVDEHLPVWVNWTIEPASHKFIKKDANTARFEVAVDPNATATVQWTVTQTW
jgi:hypothetical protein